MGGLFFGQGLGAIGLNLLRVWTLKQWPADQAASGLYVSSMVYFLITAIFMFMCGVSHLVQREKIEQIRIN